MVVVCQVCGEPFKDNEAAIMVGLTVHHQIDSGVHYAVEHPSKCLELLHVVCWGGPLDEDGNPRGMEA